MRLSNEAKVGALVLGTLVLAGIFAWMVGIQNPFNRSMDLYVTYNFAGGVEVGSPVRVSGIKVGKVESVEFFSPVDSAEIADKVPGSADDNRKTQELVPVKLKISVLNEATRGIRQDSRFFINLAGIIGERYIEITPGSMQAPPVRAGDVVKGVDPPRIDQLISQSFDLAGKITEVVERNKGDITKTVELLYKLSGNLNRTLEWVDKSDLFKRDLGNLLDNLIAITSDVKKVTGKVNTQEGKQTLDLMYKLIWRLEPLDSKTVREFLQKEGVKVQLF